MLIIQAVIEFLKENGYDCRHPNQFGGEWVASVSYVEKTGLCAQEYHSLATIRCADVEMTVTCFHTAGDLLLHYEDPSMLDRLLIGLQQDWENYVAQLDLGHDADRMLIENRWSDYLNTFEGEEDEESEET